MSANEPGEVGPKPAEPNAEAPMRRSLWRRFAGFVGSSSLNLLIAVALIALLGVVALRTALGNDVVVRGGISYANQKVAGEIRVEGVRSANLLRGARLLGVQLLIPGGDTLFVADSVEVNYRIRDLIRGSIVLSDLQVWGADIRLESEGRPGVAGPSTLARFTGPTQAEGEGAVNPVVLDGIRIFESRVRFRTPSNAPEGGVLRTEARDDLRDLALDMSLARADITRVEILPAGRGGTTIEIGSLQAQLDVLRERLEIAEAEAEFRISASRIIVDVEALRTNVGELSGVVAVGLGGPADFQLQMRAEETDLEAIRWISDRIPPLAGSFDLRGEIGGGESRWSANDVDLGYRGGRITGNGAVTLHDGVVLDGIDLALSALPRDFIAPYLPPRIAIPGDVSGRLTLNGPWAGFDVLGRLSIRDGRRVTTGDVSGMLVPQPGGIAVSGLELDLAPLDFIMASSFAPGVNLRGTGEATLELNGSVNDGLRFVADVHHRREGYAPSHLLTRGSVRRTDTWLFDIQGDASPLSLSTIRVDHPELPFEGALSGTFRVRGPLEALAIDTNLDGPFGRAELTVELNPLAIEEGVAVDGSVEAFALGRFLPSFGDETFLNGEVSFRGSGQDLSTLAGEGRLRLDASEVRSVQVDSALIVGSIVSSDLIFDTLMGHIGGFGISGSGGLAVDSMRPAQELRLTFETPSIMALRSVFMGDTVIARDTLRALDRDVLELSGIDPDTLPLLADVEVDGRVAGEVILRGSVTDFDAEGEVRGGELLWRRNYLESGTMTFTAQGLPARDSRVDYDLEIDSAFAWGRSIQQGSAMGSYAHPAGTVTANLLATGTDTFDFETSFRLEDGGVEAEVARLEVQLDSSRYELLRPAAVAWTDSVYRVRDLEIVRPGDQPVRILADGEVAPQGDADFTLSIQNLQISRMLRLAQRSDLDAEGLVDLELEISGTAVSPIIEGTIAALDVRYRQTRLGALDGSVNYQNRSLSYDIRGREGNASLLESDGRIPFDLALRPGVERYLGESMDVTVNAQAFPIEGIVTWIRDLENVQGQVTGDFRVTGTVEDPEARGELTLEGGAWTVGSVGVRQTGIRGSATLLADGVVRVEAEATAGGSGRTTGTITLTSLTDPTFNLAVALQNFQAVDRLDVTGSVSGDLTLTGRFQQPVLEGSLRVNEGTLFLDEFRSSVGVLDLSDPRFAGIIDTTDVSGRSLLNAARNPFMDGLQINIDMTVETNTWLRSDDLQVEIAGQVPLIVVYDRRRRDLALIGDLQVVRGQAVVGTRAFQVQSGSVRFLGLTGINPELQIVAVTRVRRQDGPQLNIQVDIDGTLLTPQFIISTDEQGISESDLWAYVFVGQPTSSLTSGAGVRSGAGAGSAVLGVAGSWLSGSLANQLASLASQELGVVDYLAISQVGDLGASSGFSGGGIGASFASTQVEIGRYFSNGEIFGALVLRPLSQLGASTNVVGGVRMEWQSSDAFHLEAFVEDRFLRSGGYGLSELSLGSERVIGFALIREWGY